MTSVTEAPRTYTYKEIAAEFGVSSRQIREYANAIRKHTKTEPSLGDGIYSQDGYDELCRVRQAGGPTKYGRMIKREQAEQVRLDAASSAATVSPIPSSEMPFSEAPENLTTPPSEALPGNGYLTVIQGGQQIQRYQPTSPESRITVAFSEPNQAIAPTIFGGVDFSNHGAPIQQGGVSQAINESTATMDQLLGDATGLLALLDMTEERLNARQAQAQANTDAQNAQMDKVLVKLRQRIAQLKAVGRNAEAQALEQQVEIGAKKRELGQLVGQVESLAAAVGGSVQYSQDSP